MGKWLRDIIPISKVIRYVRPEHIRDRTAETFNLNISWSVVRRREGVPDPQNMACVTVNLRANLSALSENISFSAPYLKTQ